MPTIKPTINMSSFGNKLVKSCAYLLALMILMGGSSSLCAADSTAPTKVYKLAPGDKLAVTVFGQPELSGDYLLDEAGAIVFPIIGAIEARGLTVDECQKQLASRLAEGVLTDPSVFVHVTEMRPIQVLGDVRTPGSYPFRHGTLVKSAVAFAGGTGLANQTQSAAFAEYLLADERARVLEATRGVLSVREARLRAQIDGAEMFEVPSVGLDASDPETKKFIEDERASFNTRSVEFKKQVALIQSQMPSLIAESDAIDGQIESEKKQLQIVNQQIEAYERLQKSGLTKLDSMVQTQLNAATKESNIWRLEADRSRLKLAIGELGIREQEARSTYARQVALELQEVVQKLKEVSVSLPTARELRDTKLRETGNIASGLAQRKYTITRITDGNISNIDATEMTLLEPGDIVEVKIVRPDMKAPLAALSSGNNDIASTSSAADQIYEASVGETRPEQPQRQR